MPGVISRNGIEATVPTVDWTMLRVIEYETLPAASTSVTECVVSSRDVSGYSAPSAAKASFTASSSSRSSRGKRLGPSGPVRFVVPSRAVREPGSRCSSCSMSVSAAIDCAPSGRRAPDLQ